MKILIFVYNADSGAYSSIKNKVNKMLSPESMKCKLYRLTYGRLFMKRVWKRFLGNLSYHKVFFYSKIFKKSHPEFAYLELPSILIKDGDKIKVLITAQEINTMENADDLIGLLGKKLTEL
jgi:hypothetical protein